MSRSQLVAEHLPLLRRYARALTGNQASGDAYVGAMLEALLQDQSLLDERHGPRAGLFRLFTQIWNSVSLNENAEVISLSSLSETEFQIRVNSRNSPARGPCCSSSSDGSCSRASSMAPT